MKFIRMRWAGHAARTEESRGAFSDLVGKPEGKMPIARPRRKWEDNFKMNWEVDCIVLAQDMDKWPAFVNTLMNHRIT
jgi:hypothetical protein